MALDRGDAARGGDGVESGRVQRAHELEAGFPAFYPDDAAIGRLEARELEPDLRAGFERGVGLGAEAGDRKVDHLGLREARAGLAQAGGEVDDAPLCTAAV